MNSPWEVLGVAPNCSEKELKEAYARLLKKHRPDKDPEGFRQVRDAYEWMRGHVESGSNVPSIIAEAMQQTEAGANTEPSEENDGDEAARRPQLVAANGKPDAAAIDYDLSPETQSAPEPAQFPSARRAHGVNVGVDLVTAAAARGDVDRVRKLIDGLELQLKQHASPEAAEALVAGAIFIALVDWRRAQALANAAFPNLPEHMRRSNLEELDYLIQSGRELMYISLKHRKTLTMCLAKNKADLSDQAVAEAFYAMANVTSAQTAKAYFFSRFPLPEKPPPIRNPRPKHHTAASTASSGSSSSGCSYWWVFILISGVLRGMTSCNGTSSRPVYTPTYTPPSYTSPQRMDSEETRKLIERINRMNRERNSNPNPNAPRPPNYTPQPEGTDDPIKRILEKQQQRNNSPNF